MSLVLSLYKSSIRLSYENHILAKRHIMTSSQIFVMVTLVSLLISSNALLTPHFYDKVCPQALPVINSVVKQAILREKRIGASLLRLHFHDCFVNVSYNIN